MRLDANINILLKFLLMKYFDDDYCITMVYDNHSFISDVLNDCASNSAENQYRMFTWIKITNDSNLLNQMLDVIDVGCQSYIVSLKNSTNFYNTKLNTVELTLQRNRDKRILIILDTASDKEVDILNLTEMHYFPNTLVMLVKDDEHAKFYSKNFDGFLNQSSSILELDTYDLKTHTFALNVNLFPDKLHNLNGVAINVGSVTYLPFGSIKEVKEGTGNFNEINNEKQLTIQYKGADYIFLREFCRKRNCTVRIKSYGTDDWGGVDKNGHTYGLWDGYSKKEFELMIGGLGLLNGNFLEISHILADTSILLLVPKPRELPQSHIYVAPFALNFWIPLMFVCALLMVVHMFFLSKLRGNVYSSVPKSFLIIVSVFLNQSILYRDYRALRKFCFGCIIIAGLIISSAYAGFIAGILTVPQYEKPMYTLDDFLRNKDVKWTVPSVSWLNVFTDSHIVKFQEFQNRFVQLAHDDIALAAQHPARNMAIALDLVNGGTFVFGNYITVNTFDNLQLMPERIITGNIVVRTARAWPIMDYLNKFILEVNQHGMYKLWSEIESCKLLNFQIGTILRQTLFSRSSNNPPPTQLTVAHISGALYLLVKGLFLATVAFVCEIIAWKYQIFN